MKKLFSLRYSIQDTAIDQEKKKTEGRDLKSLGRECRISNAAHSGGDVDGDGGDEDGEGVGSRWFSWSLSLFFSRFHIRGFGRSAEPL